MLHKNNSITPLQLTSWLQKNINDKELIFDKCADFFEIIMKKLEDEKIYLSVDNKVLMIKLCNFLCRNSSR